MLAIWLASGVIARVEAITPPPATGGAWGYSSNWSGVLRKLSTDEEDRLDRALDSLERNIRQARTPRVRSAKIAQAETAIAEAREIVAPAGVDLPAFADLTELSLTLRQIAAGMLEYPDWRIVMLDMVRSAREEAEAFRAQEDEDVISLLLLGH
jgi:stage V sporulation protein SpoVS